eukprot:comp18273_c0_seq1/m.32380 comp18273_c0_seq1/g.32380  ORF comp18273_c0_seq1/g.32380 comp18273_c0_seq1/m.32380 type:complete len:271 (+) comp18273_c0_seq1:53-865(+)
MTMMIKKSVAVALVVAAALLATVSAQAAVNGAGEVGLERGTTFNPEAAQPHLSTATGNFEDRLQQAAANVPPDQSVVREELGELNSLLGNYKHVDDSGAKKFVHSVLTYKPDGHPSTARTNEDRLLRELRRTAEVVKSAKAQIDGGKTTKFPLEGKIKYPEPESLDPALIMAKKAYENLPVQHGQHDLLQQSLDRQAAADIVRQDAELAAKNGLPKGAVLQRVRDAENSNAQQLLAESQSVNDSDETADLQNEAEDDESTNLPIIKDLVF